jgi:DNA polymerase-4
VLQELSLVVSVGIASNKMLAKLASQAIKPDGILVIDGEPAMQKLLKTTAVSRLPRCGGKVTDTLTLAGIHTVADLQVSLYPPLTLSRCPLCFV